MSMQGDEVFRVSLRDIGGRERERCLIDQGLHDRRSHDGDQIEGRHVRLMKMISIDVRVLNAKFTYDGWNISLTEV